MGKDQAEKEGTSMIPLLQLNSRPATRDLAELRPIRLVEACHRVGHCFDLWHSDPGRLLEILEQKLSPGCPLRALFEPAASAMNSNPPLPPPVDAPRLGTFVAGDRVKARLVQKWIDHADDAPFADSSRELYRATVEQVNDDGTVDITWEDGFGVDRVKRPEELIPAWDDASTTDCVAHILNERGSYRVGPSGYATLAIFAALVVAMPEALAAILARRRGEGWQDGARTAAGGLLSALAGDEYDAAGSCPWGEGLFVGICSLALCAGGALCLLPALYRLALVLCPMHAKRARQTFVIELLDQVSLIMLPTVFGAVERALLLLHASLVVSGITMAVLLADTGLVTLGTLLASSVLFVANHCLGELTGLQNMRQLRIQEILTRHLKSSRIAMEEEELQTELQLFLSSPNNVGIVQLSLPFVTLLASAADIQEADPVRICTVLVKDAYAEFAHEPGRLPQLQRRCDIVVDLFGGDCIVPGVSLVGERWRKEGDRLPWHLAIRKECIPQLERSLEELGLASGTGCFTWRSSRNGTVRGPEATNPHALTAFAGRLVSKHRQLDDALMTVAGHRSVGDDTRLVQIFLRARANPNWVREDSTTGFTALHMACQAGKIETAKMLIEGGADMNIRSSEGLRALEMKKTDVYRIRGELESFVNERTSIVRQELWQRILDSAGDELPVLAGGAGGHVKEDGHSGGARGGEDWSPDSPHAGEQELLMERMRACRVNTSCAVDGAAGPKQTVERPQRRGVGGRLTLRPVKTPAVASPGRCEGCPGTVHV